MNSQKTYELLIHDDLIVFLIVQGKNSIEAFESLSGQIQIAIDSYKEKNIDMVLAATPAMFQEEGVFKLLVTLAQKQKPIVTEEMQGNMESAMKMIAQMNCQHNEGYVQTEEGTVCKQCGKMI
jgi:hypothetical protein